MRWCLYIPSILILLTLGAELCSSHGVEVVKDPSHLACIMDCDDGELKHGMQREKSFTECDLLSLAGQQVGAQLLKTDLIWPLEGAEILKIHSGIRRHRWLCRECC